MWATAVETAAVGEEGGVPMSVEKFKQQIKGIWENERRFEDTVSGYESRFTYERR